MSAQAVIDISKRCFARLGIPQCVHSDNGPQLIACEFAEFSANWEFERPARHVTRSRWQSVIQCKTGKENAEESSRSTTNVTGI